MTDRFTADEVVAAISPLTRTRLIAYVEAELVIPLHTETGPVFRRIDLARLELLCDLSEQFDLEEDALGVIVSLVDRLHGVRAELRAVLGAIAQEPAEVQRRLGNAVRLARRSG